MTISGTSLAGADAGNYTVTVPASALADILARAITASVAVNNKTRIAFLSNRQIDMVLSNVSITPERTEQVSFVGPYMMSGMSLLTTSSALSEISSTDEFNRKGLKLLAISNSTNANFIKTIAPEARNDWPAFEERAARLMNQYRHLSAFPENREVLQGLKARGIPTGILSNGDPDMLAIAVRSAGLSDLLDHVLSVHDTRRFKTDPAAYQIGVDALQLPARDILFVSSNGWDAIGATWFGYTTLWVNRTGAPLERLGTPPDHQGPTLREVLALFPA